MEHRNNLVLKIVYVIFAIIVAIVIFQAGVFVGFRKATFDRSWDENYLANFGPHHEGVLGANPAQFPNAHGTIGKIIKLDSIDESSVVVEGQDNIEKLILFTPTTHIRKLKTDLTPADLALGDSLIIIGAPNSQGDIVASFIRVLPTIPNPPATQ